jgi:predicted transport protein
VKKGTLNDPNGLTKSYDGKGHWGSGDYYIIVDSKTDLDDVMLIIKQSYRNQGNEK